MPIRADSGKLIFTWPDLHSEAACGITMHRTLRIPDDGNIHRLPPSMGSFPTRTTQGLSTVPERLREGYIVPLYQAEAMWLGFTSRYPVAVKVGAGEINAVTGDALREGLGDDPQDYCAVPKQPWLDGFVVEEGKIRQFVAMPLDSGFTVEEQLTGEAHFGGLRVIVYPLKPDIYEEIVKTRRKHSFRGIQISASGAMPRGLAPQSPMGLGEGGTMQQEIYEDEWEVEDYLLEHGQSVVVNLVNSLDWFDLTGNPPPYQPPSAKQYHQHGLPWFDYYDEGVALQGSEKLRQLQSVQKLIVAMGGKPLDESLDPSDVPVVQVTTKPDEV